MMFWDYLLQMVLAQAALVILLSFWAFIFLRWLLPLLQSDKPAKSKRQEKAPTSIVAANPDGYAAAWEDMRQTIKGFREKALYRTDVEVLMTGLEQQYLGAADEETKVVKVLR